METSRLCRGLGFRVCRFLKTEGFFGCATGSITLQRGYRDISGFDLGFQEWGLGSSLEYLSVGSPRIIL